MPSLSVAPERVVQPSPLLALDLKVRSHGHRATHPWTYREHERGTRVKLDVRMSEGCRKKILLIALFF